MSRLTEAFVRWLPRCRHRLGPPLVAVSIALLLTGCRPLGPGTPTCGDLEVVDDGQGSAVLIVRPSGEATALDSSELIQLQAVPSAQWGVCIEELPPGWSTGILTAERGQAGLTVASTGLGLPFLTATLTEGCDVPADAQEVRAAGHGPTRFIEVHDITTGIEVVVIPVAARHHDAALALTATLSGREVRGTPIRLTLDAATDDITARMDRALEAGSNVVILDDDYLRRGEVELRSPDAARPLTAPLGRVLTELGDRADPEVYAATWWHPSPRSCVTYRITARGAGALDVPDRVDDALGLFPLAELRDHLDEAGIDLGTAS